MLTLPLRIMEVENEPTVTAMENGMIVAGKDVCREKR